MNLRLDPGRAPGPQIREFMEVELDHAISEARLFEDADLVRRVEVVRQIRKATKRVRSAVSLLDPTVGDRFRRQVRHCARTLSSMRDRDVIRQTLLELADTDRKVSEQLAKRDLHVRLMETEDAEPGDPILSDEKVVASVLRDLEGVRARIPTMHRRDLKWQAVIDRVARSWQRARRAFRSEWSARDIESLHDARKAVIRLESQLVLVEAISTPGIRRTRRELRSLARDLGADRDLMMVCDRAESLAGSRSFARHRQNFVERLLEDRRSRLRAIRNRGRRALDAHSGRIRAKMVRHHERVRKDPTS